MALLQCYLQLLWIGGSAVVLNDGGASDYILLAEGAKEIHPLERAASAEGYIGLSCGKCAVGEVDGGVVER